MNDFGDSPQRPELCTVLFISDFDCHPAELTARLGVEPSHTMARGKRVKPHMIGRRIIAPIAKTSSWSLKTSRTAACGLDALITELLSRFDTCWGVAVDICATSHVELLTEIWVPDEYSQLTFDLSIDRTNLRKLAELNAHIGFDVYW